MTKEQTEELLVRVINSLKLTKDERDSLTKAVETLKGE